MGRWLSVPGLGAGFLVVGTVGPLLVATPLPDLLVLVVLLVGGAAGWAICLDERVLRDLGARPLSSGVVLAPVATALVAELMVVVGIASSAVPELGGFLGMGVGGGSALVSGAQRRYIEETVGSRTPLATWRARPAPGRTRQRLLVGLVLVAIPAVYVLAWLADATIALPFLIVLVVLVLPAGLGAVALVGTIPGEYEAYGPGIRLAATSTVLSGFVPAERLTGYSIAGDAITVHRDAWWVPDLQFDRSDVDDVDAVVAALERYER